VGGVVGGLVFNGTAATGVYARSRHDALPIGGKISKRERDHLRAFLTYAASNLSQATEEWISILVDHPLGEL